MLSIDQTRHYDDLEMLPSSPMVFCNVDVHVGGKAKADDDSGDNVKLMNEKNDEWEK